MITSLYKKIMSRLAPFTSNKPNENDLSSVQPNSPDELLRAFEAMNSAVWIIDKHNLILFANKASENLFNLSRQEMLGKQCWEIAHQTGQPHKGCPFVRAKSTLQRESMELQIGEKWYEVVVDPILDSEGEFSRYIHIITDITDKIKISEELKRSKRLHTNTQRLAKTGGWEWNISEQKMYWTEEMYRLHGLDSSNFEPGSPEHIEASIKCYNIDDRAMISEAFQQCAEKGIAYDLEFEIRKASGENIWIRTVAEPVWLSGNIEKITGNVMDITEFKVAKDELIVQSERIKTLFNAIDDAIFVHPLQEEGFAPFIEVNDVACKRYGYTYEEFMSLSSEDITIKPDVDGHSQFAYREELLETRHLIIQTVHIKKSGEEFPVEINSNIFYEHNKPHILTVVRDITKRREQERKRELLIEELQEALENIKTLEGLLPICSKCKKIRDDQGDWNLLESYIQEHSDASFSHGICPECSDKMYGNEAWYQELKKEKKL